MATADELWTTIRELRAEVEALMDKARRFRGWRVRVEYLDRGVWKTHRTDLFDRKAARDLRDGFNSSIYRSPTLVRVYRPAVPR